MFNWRKAMDCALLFANTLCVGGFVLVHIFLGKAFEEKLNEMENGENSMTIEVMRSLMPTIVNIGAVMSFCLFRCIRKSISYDKMAMISMGLYTSSSVTYMIDFDIVIRAFLGKTLSGMAFGVVVTSLPTLINRAVGDLNISESILPLGFEMGLLGASTINHFVKDTNIALGIMTALPATNLLMLYLRFRNFGLESQQSIQVEKKGIPTIILYTLITSFTVLNFLMGIDVLVYKINDIFSETGFLSTAVVFLLSIATIFTFSFMKNINNKILIALCALFVGGSIYNIIYGVHGISMGLMISAYKAFVPRYLFSIIPWFAGDGQQKLANEIFNLLVNSIGIIGVFLMSYIIGASEMAFFIVSGLSFLSITGDAIYTNQLKSRMNNEVTSVEMGSIKSENSESRSSSYDNFPRARITEITDEESSRQSQKADNKS